MNPSEIKRLLTVAAQLNSQRSGTPEAFLLQYIAWEALKVRILITGMTYSGLTVKDARGQIDVEKVWQSSNYEKLFKKYFGSLPANAKGVGKYFNIGNQVDNLRHSFVHGSFRLGPKSYRKASKMLDEIFAADWGKLLGDLLGSSGPVDPMSRLSKNEAR